VFRLFAQARMLVCNETFWAHLASVAGTPTVAVWGLGHWGRFVPVQGRITVLHTEMICAGCDWRCCFDDVQCVASIPDSALASAIRERWQCADAGVWIRSAPTPVSSAEIADALRAQLNETLAASRRKEWKIISLMAEVRERKHALQGWQEENRQLAEALRSAEKGAADHRQKFESAQQRADAMEARYWQERQKPLRVHAREAIFGRKD
jgi:hypothetical protein